MRCLGVGEEVSRVFLEVGSTAGGFCEVCVVLKGAHLKRGWNVFRGGLQRVDG